MRWTPQREIREEMLQMKDVFGRTPMHWAAAEGHKDVLLAVHDRLSGDEWFKVLQMKDNDGFGVVHHLAHGRHHNVIISVKATIPDVNQWHKLVCKPIPQFHGNVWTNFGKHCTAVIVLNKFRVQAKIGKAINTSNIIGELRI